MRLFYIHFLYGCFPLKQSSGYFRHQNLKILPNIELMFVHQKNILFFAFLFLFSFYTLSSNTIIYHHNIHPHSIYAQQNTNFFILNICVYSVGVVMVFVVYKIRRWRWTRWNEDEGKRWAWNVKRRKNLHRELKQMLWICNEKDMNIYTSGTKNI